MVTVSLASSVGRIEGHQGDIFLFIAGHYGIETKCAVHERLKPDIVIGCADRIADIDRIGPQSGCKVWRGRCHILPLIHGLPS